MEVATQKEKELNDYMSQLEQEYGLAEDTRYLDFKSALDAQATQYEAALSSFSQQQQAAAQAQQQAEAQRAAEAYASKISQFEASRQGLQGIGLTTDYDNFAQEYADFGKYWSELGTQLAGAGYNINELAGDYATQFNESIRGTQGATQSFQDFISSVTGNSSETLMGQYGTAQNLQAYGTQQRDTYQKQYDQYSNQINQLLGNLGSIYSAYNQIGSLENAQGSTPEEKLGYLTGLGTQPVFSSIDDYYQGFSAEYMDYANKLAGLYKTDNPTQTQNILGQYTGELQGLTGQLETAKSDYLSQYSNATQQLLSLYGDVNAVTSGLFSNTASNLQGQLGTSASNLSSLLGRQENELLDLQNLYESTVSQLKRQRLGEKQSLMSQRVQGRANRNRNKSLRSSDSGTQARTLGLSSLLEDNLGLTRGYSLLG
jgi:hypothetical protein